MKRNFLAIMHNRFAAAGVAAALTGLSLSCSPSQPLFSFQPVRQSEFKGPRGDIAAKLAVYAIMASNSYKNSRSKPEIPLAVLGWRQWDDRGGCVTPGVEAATTTEKSGFAADVYEKGNTVVVAFRGTDSKWDWITGNFTVIKSPQAECARNFIETSVRPARPHSKIICVGHSLGGGLALHCSARLGLDAYVFDSSPRIFDGLGDHHKPAIRVAAFNNGDILRVARKAWTKDDELVKAGDIHQFDFGHSGGGKPDAKLSPSRHHSYVIASGLLVAGSLRDSSLKKVLQEAEKQGLPLPPRVP